MRLCDETCLRRNHSYTKNNEVIEPGDAQYLYVTKERKKSFQRGYTHHLFENTPRKRAGVYNLRPHLTFSFKNRLGSHSILSFYDATDEYMKFPLFI